MERIRATLKSQQVFPLASRFGSTFICLNCSFNPPQLSNRYILYIYIYIYIYLIYLLLHLWK